MIEVVHPGELGDQQPATTFWIQCYAHERYVAQSVRSALAQRGPALEILISDDASPDRTFEIASAIARSYSGPHRVALLQSAGNRGIFGHVNETIPHLRGAFIVWQASDDVARPDRAQRLFETAASADATAAFSNHRLIDGTGTPYGLGLPTGRSYTIRLEDYAVGRCFDFTLGGTLGFRRTVFDRFGPLPDPGGGLEHMFEFRSALLGEVVYCPEPLVDRRRHSASLTIGMGTGDRADDPLAVHERRLQKRLGILGRLAGHRAAMPLFLIEGIAAQQRCDTKALENLRRFRGDLAEAADPLAARWRHAARDFDPPALTLVGTCAPGLNLLAYEGRYHAVPQRLGAIEPCGLRGGSYPGVISAWTQVELAAALAARGTAFELTERG